MTTRRIRKLYAEKLKKHIRVLTAERDELRTLANEYEEIIGCTDDAIRDLENAVDALTVEQRRVGVRHK